MSTQHACTCTCSCACTTCHMGGASQSACVKRMSCVLNHKRCRIAFASVGAKVNTAARKSMGGASTPMQRIPTRWCPTDVRWSDDCVTYCVVPTTTCAPVRGVGAMAVRLRGVDSGLSWGHVPRDSLSLSLSLSLSGAGWGCGDGVRMYLAASLPGTALLCAGTELRASLPA